MSNRSKIATDRDESDKPPGFQMPPTVFTGLAVLWLAFLVLLGFLVVVSASYLHSTASADHALDRGWALLSALAFGWALVNLFWSRQAAQNQRSGGETSGNLMAVYSHVAMALGCGLIALGIHSVMFARALGSAPVVMDYSQSGKRSQANVAAPVAMAEGNAEEGQKIFSTTCITCHGPTGGGLPNLAPSLRDSEFIAAADAAAVAGVIRLGRAATDPNNKSKKVMPARGGNPFLGDDKIVHLVAFIRSVQGASAETAIADAAPNAPPPVQLSKWVVPAGPTPPSGMISLSGRDDIGDDASLIRRDQQRRDLLSQVLILGLTGIHGLFLVGVMVVSSDVLFRRLKEEDVPSGDESEWSISTVGWLVATVVWLIVFVMGFVWM
ncbi:c-type cytochrome [Novipirellula sp. SH528]|uniref:c-type cytochrome n=1 Tax=Novipirellula sp. SH528 TaxID=3454466 RepID=UPI003FA05E44